MFGQLKRSHRALAVALVSVPLAAVVAILPSASAYADGSNSLTSWCSDATSAAAAVAVAPATLAGSATEAGVEVAGVAAADVTAPVALSALAFAASFCGTTAVMHWLFGSSHTIEPVSEVSASSTTTYGKGCWSAINQPPRTDVTTTACAAGSWPYSQWLFDGMQETVTSYDTGSVTMTIVQLPTVDRADAVVRLAWTLNREASGASIEIQCHTSGTNPAIQSAVSTSPGQTQDFTFPSACSGAGNYVAVVNFWYIKVNGKLFGQYSAAGHAVDPDPSYVYHKLRYVLGCTDSSGTLVTTTTYSALFYEAQASGTYPPISIGPCAAGSHMTSYEVAEGDPTGAGGTDIYHWTASTDPSGSYPECMPGGVQAPCLLRLRKIGVTGLPSDCTSPGVDCTTFDPTQATDQTDTYTCQWGTYAVGLTDCEAVPRTSAPPETSTDTPLTGANPDPGDGTNCMGSAWSWNPVNWVYIPIKCAFLPTHFSATNLVALRDLLASKPPFSVVVAVASSLGGLADGFSGGGCSAFPDFSPAQDGSLQLPCEPFYSSSSTWLAMYDVAAIAISVATLLGIYRIGVNALRPGAE